MKFKFAEIYSECKTNKERAEFKARICEGCNYKERTFWKRKRGDFEEILVTEIVVWMKVAGKRFEDIVQID